jgi:molybdopterin/thiamine biosynthesis adenylyltransferase
LRLVLGGDLRAWTSLSLLGACVGGYFWLLRRLKARVKVPVAAPQPIVTKGKFSDAELDRYARHIMLREIGGPGQKALKAAKVLVIGAGGLGSPALLYLAAAGVGTIGVVDDDTVDASNLQRQIIHKDQGIGMPKVQSAQEAVRALNPFVTVLPYQRRLTADNADILSDFDLVLDGSDNFDTRYLVNREAALRRKPLISGAITQWEGQLSLFDPAHGTPCYECVFADRPAPGMVPTCAEAGVAAPLPGVIGAMMAMEAVKHITGAGQTLRGRLLIHDALYAETRVIEITRRADCPVCGASH